MSILTLLATATLLGLAPAAQTAQAATDTVLGMRTSPVLLEARAKLVASQVPVDEALRQLERASGVPLAWSSSLLPRNRLVSCSCEHVSVGQALGALLAGLPFGFDEVGSQVIIEPRPQPRLRTEDPLRRPSSNAVFAAVTRVRHGGGTYPVDQALGVVAGVVADARSLEPISGAQVEVVDTDRDGSTDANGRFRIDRVPGEEATLRVNRIGYRTLTQRVRVGDESIQIRLESAPIDLQEIVITGTPGGTERRAIGTGLSTINASELRATTQTVDVSQMISGRAAGALVRLGTGAAGGGSRITLRGSASLSLNDQPLIYVDGVRVDNTVGAGLHIEGAGAPNAAMSRINDINPNDIERIEIIKGPAASTLYGTEASNGVIQIITRRGSQADGISWNVTSRQGVAWLQQPSTRFNLIHGVDGAGDIVTINPYEHARSQGEQPFRRGHLQGYGLSASGGSGIFRFRIGGDLDVDQGADPTNELRYYRGRLNLGMVPSPALQVNTNVAYVRGQNTLPNDGGFGGPIWALQNIRPALIQAGGRGWLLGSPEDWNRAFDTTQDINRITAGVQVVHQLGWFQHRLNLGGDLLYERSELIAERMGPELASVFGQGLATGRRIYFDRNAANATVDWAASATAPLSDRIGSTTSVGVQYNQKTQHQFTGSGAGFPASGLRTISGTAIRDIAESFVENKTLGIYLQETLTINDRLYLTAAVRADDNSAFGSEFSFATYPKASVAWVLSDEPFWSLDWMGTLRLRSAYGRSGQQPDIFDALRTFAPVTAGGGAPAVRPATIGNPDLQPEISEEFEIGFDAAVLNDRLDIEFTVYNQETRDGIVAREVAPSSGFSGSRLVNVGELTNRGLELLVNVRAFQSSWSQLDLMFNLGTNDNTVVQSGHPLGFISLPNNQRHMDGYPAGAFFDRRVVSASLNPATGLAEDILCDDGVGGTISCEAAPAVYLGRSMPTRFGAFGPTLALGDLRVNALVEFQAGHRRVDSEIVGQCNVGTCAERFFPERFDPTHVAAQQIQLFTDFGLQDASFAKLREVAVSYTLPEEYAGRLGAHRASITLSGKHLYTWTGYDGLDPEPLRLSQSFNVNNFGLTPPPASFQARVDLSF